MAKKVPVCNCDYNKMKQLTKALQLLWNIEGYKKDAKKERHAECVKMWDQIEKNVLKNEKLLRNVVEKRIKKGRLC